MKKSLGIFSIFCIASGAMISSGLFVLPGIAYKVGGPGIVLSYLIAILIIIPAMFSNAELATAMPKSGGDYFFIGRSLGPLLGTIAGLLDWLALSLKASFALVGISALATLIFPTISPFSFKAISIAFCLFFTVLNLLSVKEAARLQNILVSLLLLLLSIYFIFVIKQVDVHYFKPFIPWGWKSIFSVAGMVFVSFGGLTKIASVAGEVKDPGKNIPLGMFSAFALVSSIYILIIYVTIGVLDGNTLSGSLTPLSLGAKEIFGYYGEILIGIASFLAFATTANAGIMAASRSPMAMSHDGLLPKYFSNTNWKYSTPYTAIIFTSLFISFVMIFLSIETLVKTASTIMILVFMLLNISVIVMRNSNIEGYRPKFKSPFFPIIQILAVIIYMLIIFEMGKTPIALSTFFSVGALLWYFIYVRKKISFESGVIHMVKNITNTQISRSNIENELRIIALERDNIQLDRFDKIIQKCQIIDIEERMNQSELFNTISSELSNRLNIPSKTLIRLFEEREKDTSTVILPWLAIPHIIIEGSNIFDVLVLRCKNGIEFNTDHKEITTIFTIVGSIDERNFHLKSLMTIAHIVNEEKFLDRWLSARNEEQLRDIILLSERKRIDVDS